MCVYTGAAVWYCGTFGACLPECMYVYVLIWTGMFAIPCSRIVFVWTHVLTGYVYIMWNGQGEIEFTRMSINFNICKLLATVFVLDS